MKKNKTIKAWGILHIKTVAPWGTPVTQSTHNQNIWQYPIFPRKKDAKSWLNQRNLYWEKTKVVRCVITY